MGIFIDILLLLGTLGNWGVGIGVEFEVEIFCDCDDCDNWGTGGKFGTGGKLPLMGIFDWDGDVDLFGNDGGFCGMFIIVLFIVYCILLKENKC